MLQAIYGRICERLGATGLGAREASRLAGLHPDAIRNIRRAVEGGQTGRVGVSTRTLAALAPVLGTTSAWLLEGATGDVEGAPADVGGKLLFVEWARAAGYADADAPLNGERWLDESFGRWPRGCFATRVPDDAMNRLAPAGGYIVVDRSDRTPIEGLSYLGVLDGAVIFRRWFGKPERVEPFSNDPAFRTEFLSSSRRWEIIGRVTRAIVDV
jgi:SOS-response transcriptional repressor LexA